MEVTSTDGIRAALAAKDEGMARGAANANQAWMDYMLRQTELTAMEMPRFTADDVQDRVDADANAVAKPSTHDNRAFGTVMKRAAERGFCSKADVAPIPSRRKSLHASPRAVWNSLLYRR